MLFWLFHDIQYRKQNFHTLILNCLCPAVRMAAGCGYCAEDDDFVP